MNFLEARLSISIRIKFLENFGASNSKIADTGAAFSMGAPEKSQANANNSMQVSFSLVEIEASLLFLP